MRIKGAIWSGFVYEILNQQQRGNYMRQNELLNYSECIVLGNIQIMKLSLVFRTPLPAGDEISKINFQNAINNSKQRLK